MLACYISHGYLLTSYLLVSYLVGDAICRYLCMCTPQDIASYVMASKHMVCNCVCTFCMYIDHSL